MDFSLAIKNIVAVGILQPSKFDKYFFISNNIIQDNEILPNSIFNPEVIQILTRRFTLVILPNQVVVSSNELAKDGTLIVNLIKFILEKFEPTCTALGINFHWNIIAQDSLNSTTKELFYDKNNKLISEFFNYDIPQNG